MAGDCGRIAGRRRAVCVCVKEALHERVQWDVPLALRDSVCVGGGSRRPGHAACWKASEIEEGRQAGDAARRLELELVGSASCLGHVLEPMPPSLRTHRVFAHHASPNTARAMKGASASRARSRARASEKQLKRRGGGRGTRPEDLTLKLELVGSASCLGGVGHASGVTLAGVRGSGFWTSKDATGLPAADSTVSLPDASVRAAGHGGRRPQRSSGGAAGAAGALQHPSARRRGACAVGPGGDVLAAPAPPAPARQQQQHNGGPGRQLGHRGVGRGGEAVVRGVRRSPRAAAARRRGRRGRAERRASGRRRRPGRGAQGKPRRGPCRPPPGLACPCPRAPLALTHPPSRQWRAPAHPPHAPCVPPPTPPPTRPSKPHACPCP
jgi:hypothetical protein